MPETGTISNAITPTFIDLSPAAAPAAVAAAPAPLPGMGALLSDHGCTFRVWAPFADEVFVAGDFTSPPWEPGKIPLQRDTAGGAYWSAFVPNVAEGDQ